MKKFTVTYMHAVRGEVSKVVSASSPTAAEKKIKSNPPTGYRYMIRVTDSKGHRVL